MGLNHSFVLLRVRGSYAFYIGYDRQRQGYVEHWLDVFEGSGATAVGLGTMSGDTIALHFNYSDGAFRNTMRYAQSRNGR